MSKFSCLLILTILCTLAAAEKIAPEYENVLDVDLTESGNEEIEEHKLINKCYDKQTKSSYKVDSTWYPEGKCEQRVCSRERNSKSPTIKSMVCEPCTSCTHPDQTCQPFRAEKNYPKCCPKCLAKSDILKKTTKKHKQI
ncbi:Hypothetical protein CINCED_3A023432 [Cinara cedri]|uniref:Uncharacterized protein n=1 Tax=Cinara cedri TaxID=506608 RepID=A0A5E4LYM6_9HEMI|nr:Hypothetical protein CINCED_3A023432 [Cinara cedri]